MYPLDSRVVSFMIIDYLDFLLYFHRSGNKTFSKDTVFNAHLVAKKHLKAVERMNSQQQNNGSTDVTMKEASATPQDGSKEVYSHQFQIQEIVTRHLMEAVTSTKDAVVKKQARTINEILADIEQREQEVQEEAMAAEEEEEEEEEIEEVKMTIDNYPVGWDGKPIPYWLYKLHGLGVEYKCEICGNTSYYGRKAFEKHFTEWRHAHGMRCLGIPNSRHFFDITKINDAILLYDKLKRDNVSVQWKAEMEEEFEDKDGHVFNRKTYDDLKRQGLL